jgi:AcrR family transcriptional regulator
MSRQPTTPDATVLEAAQRVISRLGPARFTLADIAAEAGLAPATLIQRFGSKRGLLLALAKMAAKGAPYCFAKVRAENRSPLKVLFVDLTDPEFRCWTLLSARAILAGYRYLLEDAIRAGELLRCDTLGLARLIQAATHGSMVDWAFHQEGQVGDWMRRDMELLLKPYRVARKRKK